ERIIPVDRRQRPREEGSLAGESRWSELRGCVVAMVQQIVDLRENLYALAKLVADSYVDHAVSRRSPRPEIIDSIGSALVILVAARIGARYRNEVEVRGDFPGDPGIREGLEHVLRDEWNAIARLNPDHTVHAWRSS